MSKSYCPNCGSERDPANEFCNSCGARIESEPGFAPSQTNPPPPPPQQQYSPPPMNYKYGASAQTTYVQPGKHSSQTDTLGIVSLISAIAGFIFWVIFPFLSPVLHIVGLITGIMGMKKSPTNKGLSVAGLVLSIIGLVASILIIVLVILYFSAFYFYM